VKAFAAYPLRNAVGKADANEFRREAERFHAVVGWPYGLHVFDNSLSMPGRRAAVLEPLSKCSDLDVFSLFCHGWHNGVQAGFRSSDVRDLASALHAVSAPALRVVLYCCSNGADGDGDDSDEREPGPGGDGGFADLLRDALCELGTAATVYAHSVKGHTTRNPFVRVFLPDERFGGHWLVEPRGRLWPAWLRFLHGNDGRFRFPFMTPEQLKQELESA
jgi:hypothetical protein